MASRTTTRTESNHEALEPALNDLKASGQRAARQGGAAHEAEAGFDHGVGHPLLLLCDAKASNCWKNKAFEDSCHYSEWPKVAAAVIEARKPVGGLGSGHVAIRLWGCWCAWWDPVLWERSSCGQMDRQAVVWRRLIRG